MSIKLYNQGPNKRLDIYPTVNEEIYIELSKSKEDDDFMQIQLNLKNANQLIKAIQCAIQIIKDKDLEDV